MQQLCQYLKEEGKKKKKEAKEAEKLREHCRSALQEAENLQKSFTQMEEAQRELARLFEAEEEIKETARLEQSFKRGRKGKKLSRGGKGNTAEELQYYRRKSKSHESGIERNKKGCTGSRAE